jgi:hypothetical protein
MSITRILNSNCFPGVNRPKFVGKRTALGTGYLPPMLTNLQQSATFRPFMRKLSVFSHIARRASYNQIVRSVRSPTANRINMIYMVFLADFLMAVIAFSFLAPILGLYILLSKGTRCQLLASIAVKVVDSPFTGVVLDIISCISFAFFCMLLIIFTDTQFLAFRVPLVHIVPIAWFLCQIPLPTLCFAWLALGMQSTQLSISQIKVFDGSGLVFVTCSTFSKSLWRCVQSFFPIASRFTFRAFAFLTQGCQKVRLAFIGPEELLSCRFVRIASMAKLQMMGLLLRGVFGYDVIHNGNQLSVITPPVVSATRGQNHGQFDLFNYTMNPLQKQVYAHFS